MARDEPVEVLQENWNAVNVFLRCQRNVVAGAGGALYLSVPALEVQAACSAMQVPFDFQLLDDVQFLARELSAIQNQR
jgi:hypothetical protein